MFLSVIIVNYRSSSLLLDCLQTVIPAANTAMEVIVVDNFSQDDSETIIRRAFPQVQWIQLHYNSGFARANNAGITVAKGDAILLLNPDTLLEGNALEECSRRLLASAHVAGGVQLLNPDRTPQITGNYFITGGLNQLMALPYIGRVIRWLGYTLKVKKTNVPQAKGTVEVDWINGAFLMVKKEAVEKAGMLDEDFFLYFEEIEWCGRLRKIGKMCIYGDLNVIHLQGSTANEAFESTGQGYYNLYDRKGLQIMISGMLRIRKQYGTGWFIFHLLFYFFTIPVFFLGIMFSYPFKSSPEYSFRHFSGYIKNYIKLLTLSGKIIRNNPYFYKML